MAIPPSARRIFLWARRLAAGRVGPFKAKEHRAGKNPPRRSAVSPKLPISASIKLERVHPSGAQSPGTEQFWTETGVVWHLTQWTRAFHIHALVTRLTVILNKVATNLKRSGYTIDDIAIKAHVTRSSSAVNEIVLLSLANRNVKRRFFLLNFSGLRPFRCAHCFIV